MQPMSVVLRGSSDGGNNVFVVDCRARSRLCAPIEQEATGRGRFRQVRQGRHQHEEDGLADGRWVRLVHYGPGATAVAVATLLALSTTTVNADPVADPIGPAVPPTHRGPSGGGLNCRCGTAAAGR